MNGKEFEKICIERMAIEKKRKRATMGRYGVQGTFIGDKEMAIEPFMERLLRGDRLQRLQVIREIIVEARKTGGGWQKMESNPDFEGVIFGCGQQFTFDCKVCGDASFPLDKETGSQSRQLRHLLERGEFGAIAFYLIHFTERVLTKTTIPPITVAFPVHPDHPFWVSFMRGESKRIARDDCEQYGVEVVWDLATDRATKKTPNVLDAIFRLREMDRSAPSAPAPKAKAAKKSQDERKPF